MIGARGTRIVIAVAICFTIIIALAMIWRTPSSITGIGYVQTPSGPLGPADVDLLNRVKQAGMWEMPVGEELETKASTPRLNEVGKLINQEHATLNDLTDRAANEVGVLLPDQSTAEQRSWVAELHAMPSGLAYDRLAVERLREAHGIVLPILAQVYAGTRNDTIRELAAGGIAYVSRHIGYLESTGLVNHAHLPEMPQPKPVLSPVKEGYYAMADKPTLIFTILVVTTCLLGAAYVIRTMIKGRRR